MKKINTKPNPVISLQHMKKTIVMKMQKETKISSDKQ